MKAFIPCAGLGTRLKPWTDSHPKALFPVDGIPMLEIVVDKIRKFGINDITVNVHHFAGQIIDFIKEKGWSVNISVEEGSPLETGGGLLHASEFLCKNSEPVLVHNVDILSNADFESIEKAYERSGSLATLLVSERNSSRMLIFDKDMRLTGWHSVKTGEYRPNNIILSPEFRMLAFSGIYVVEPRLIENMQKQGWEGKFSIIDYFLSTLDCQCYRGLCADDLVIKDIGH